MDVHACISVYVHIYKHSQMHMDSEKEQEMCLPHKYCPLVMFQITCFLQSFNKGLLGINCVPDTGKDIADHDLCSHRIHYIKEDI
jgi:hypothetical protein